MKTREVSANETRLPEPAIGEAIVVSRYSHDRRKAVILHPEDFALFERLLGVFGEERPAELSLSDTEVEAHRIGEAGEDIEEFDFSAVDSPRLES